MTALEQIEYCTVDEATGQVRHGCIRPSGIYRPRDVADAIQKTPAHVYSLIKKGRLRCVRLGGDGPMRVIGESAIEFALGEK